MKVVAQGGPDFFYGGADDGEIVGECVGRAVVGLADGLAGGRAVGTSVVGAADGELVDDGVLGLCVGAREVGALVGTADGEIVGESVGETVGASVSGHHSPSNGATLPASTCTASAAETVPAAFSMRPFVTG